jgi:hypothetical protein
MFLKVSTSLRRKFDRHIHEAPLAVLSRIRQASI